MLMTVWVGWEGAEPVPNLLARAALEKQRFSAGGLASSNHFNSYSSGGRVTKNNFLRIRERHEKGLESSWGLLEVREGVFLSMYSMAIIHSICVMMKFLNYSMHRNFSGVTCLISRIHAKEWRLIKSCS